MNTRIRGDAAHVQLVTGVFATAEEAALRRAQALKARGE